MTRHAGTRTGLRLTGLNVERGGLAVCRDVDLVVEPGRITVLLGPNGAGKTTLLEAVSGVLPIASGRLELDGASLAGVSRERRARRGMSHVEQGRTVFTDLTVQENLAIVGGAAGCQRAFQLFPELERRRSSRAGVLSGGEQQMVAVARALTASPTLLLLDELSLGLAPIIVKRLLSRIASLAEEGIGILLVEQYAPLALAIGHRACVMNRGSIVFAGTCDELLERDDVLHSAYLAAGKLATNAKSHAEEARE